MRSVWNPDLITILKILCNEGKFNLFIYFSYFVAPIEPKGPKLIKKKKTRNKQINQATLA